MSYLRPINFLILNVLRHYKRYTFRYVFISMQLTSKWASLYYTTVCSYDISQSCYLPLFGKLCLYFSDYHFFKLLSMPHRIAQLPIFINAPCEQIVQQANLDLL